MDFGLSTPVRDLLLVGLGLLGAAALPRRTRLYLAASFARFAQKRFGAGLAAIGLAVILVRLCCLPVLPRPKPGIPDESSHLLLAGTLASGRLSNPMHPMWRHFETLFVLQRPRYASVYPPVQGSFLALGMILFRDAWLGVLLSVGAMCAAIAWMLAAYGTRFWALYGGVLAAAGFGVFGYWANSYWGGAGAATGGALVFGALPRIFALRRRRDALALGAGLFILANSRPYEGFVVSLPVAAFLAFQFCRPRPHGASPRRAQFAVILAAIAAGAVLTCWYNCRVTGNPFRLPYQTYIQQYAAAPAFFWQPRPPAPDHHDRELRNAHLSFQLDYAAYSTAGGILRKSLWKLGRLGLFYFGPFWALALAMVPGILRGRRLRLLFSALAMCIVAILLTVSFQVHYAAPCACIFALILVEAFRRVYLWSRMAGILLILAAPPAWMAIQALESRAGYPSDFPGRRAQVMAGLAAQGGSHLVFVRYGPFHPLGQEWVYNEPDIDSSKVVWARDLGEDLNHKLIEYYPGRKIWIVDPDAPNAPVVRYR